MANVTQAKMGTRFREEKWDDIYNIIPEGPVFLRNFGVIDRDWRIPGNPWVPSEWINKNSLYQIYLETYLHYSTTDPTALPVGWSLDGIGNLTGGGASKLLVSASDANNFSLVYSMPDLGANDRLAVVCKMKVTHGIAPTSAGSILFGDGRGPRVVMFFVSSFDAGILCQYNGSVSTQPRPNVTTDEVWYFNHGPDYGWASIMSDPERTHEASTDSSMWVAIPGVPTTVAFMSYAGAMVTTEIEIEYVAIYTLVAGGA